MVHRAAAALLAAGLATGCQEDTLRVASVQVGRTLNSDNSVGIHTTSFKPEDTMQAAVITEGRGKATIVARWSYGGRVVNETSKDVSYTDHAATEFHLQPSGAFPPGEYTLDIIYNGQPLETRSLRVAQ